MRIAVNARLLLPGKLEGLGRFASESLKRVTRDHPEHEFIFIFDRKPAAEFIFSGNIIPVVAHPQARHPVLWYLFFEWGVPPVLSKYKADIFVSPDGWLSLRSKTPSLAVIHDLNFFHNPGWIGKIPMMYYNRYFPKFIRKADRLATVSEFSKSDISQMFHVDPEKIDVLGNGAGEDLKALPDEEKFRVRGHYTSGRPYFLFLGLVHPRKNLTRIIQAYEQFRLSKNTNYKLLVVGSTKYWTDDTRIAWEGSEFKDDIILKGRLSDAEAKNILASCEALVYTSLFEGFGIPILEAFRCQVPVITSNITSMPEVGGDAVIYADPLSVESIAEAMKQVCSNSELTKDLVQRGLKQLEKFSWQITADKLWESIVKTYDVRYEI
jgi:glycosyltransferase involved in cell wall biosynthesis